MYIKKLVMQGFKSFPRKTEIPFTPGINVFLGPNGSGKCLAGESLVHLGDGSIERIDSLVEKNLSKAARIEDGFIAPGDGTEVMCLDMNTLKTSKKKIKAFVKRASPDKLLKIKTRSGREIIATKYHPLFILKDEKVNAARVDELYNGVRIAVPRHISFFPINLYFSELLDIISFEDNIYVPYREEYKRILLSLKNGLTWKALSESMGFSYYVIKGLLDKQSININYLVKILRKAGLSNMQMIEIIPEIISNGKRTKFSFLNSPDFSRFFGYLLAEGRLADSSQIWFTNGSKEIVDDYVSLVEKLFGKTPLIREYKPNCWDVIIFSEPLKKILNKLGMASQTEKKLISNVLLKHSGKKEIGNLLSGLYSGDGYVANSLIEITTKSDNLADGIGICLARLGITYMKKRVIKKISRLNFSGEYWTISSYGAGNMRAFDNLVPIVHKKKADKIREGMNKKPNPNTDLIEINSLVRKIVMEEGINIKKIRKEYPLLDAYCYNQCLPSRSGVSQLSVKLFKRESESLKQLKNLAESDIYWDEIIDIQEINGSNWVYDLTIDEHHNFIANNIFAHNSNISDAICFVLGRMSMKSLRAARAGNLIFLGGENIAPAKEASVEIVFDNSNKIFSVDKPEIAIKRIVRRSGQSIYKINGETKTRQEVLSLLAQAGVDPQGFNIILQGEIQNFVRMQAEERRNVLEEVSGISIYESRKEKSIRELEKTEEKLKEVHSILRERTAYLNNLEKERQQALKYKKLESDIRKLKASIINSDLVKKKREAEALNSDIERKNKEIAAIKKAIFGLETEIKNTEAAISKINRQIHESTGIEQEAINKEIANLRAELAALNVKKENYSSKISEFSHQKKDLQEAMKSIGETAKQLKKTGWSSDSKAKEVEKKRLELEKIEDIRKKFYMERSELKNTKERLQDKSSLLQNYSHESGILLKQIEAISLTLFDKRSSKDKLDKLKRSMAEKKDLISIVLKRGAELEKTSHTSEAEIENQKRMLEKISRMDTCPVCKSKITREHMEIIKKDMMPSIESLKKKIESSDKELREIYEKRDLLSMDIEQISGEISKTETDMAKLSSIEEKKEQIKTLQKKTEELNSEISSIEKKIKKLEEETDANSRIEEKYETIRIEVEEASIMTKENVDSEVSFKEREIERIRIQVKQITRNENDASTELSSLATVIGEKEGILEKKKAQEEQLTIKFKELISERDSAQKKTSDLKLEVSKKQHEAWIAEQETNEFRIEKARKDAEAENLETEFLSFQEKETIRGNREFLSERLSKAQEIFSNIGSVNLRSLEVYESVKKEYDLIKEKAETIEKEKLGILKIIEEIDMKKKKVFLQTLKALNELFSRNFSQLSPKGQVYLELENPKEPFEPGAGVQITVKAGHGRYFDVKSLSGGEQTLVALSLIFAIQEYRPYYFYLLDEIDAALDKRNSERLAGLLNKYMQKGQYVIITHNDEVISRATNLYGVSMNGGISKIISLKV